MLQIDWLNQQQTRLDKVFFEEYCKTRDAISEAPFLFPKICKECHRSIIKRFLIFLQIHRKKRMAQELELPLYHY